jgi:hypothetical protein
MNAPLTTQNLATYNFAYLDEQTKRMIRRAILKGIAMPGYQVPFASREMPMPYGWGTGGVQVTAAIIGPDDVLKVIDQGADDTTNAVSIRVLRQDRGGGDDQSTGEATIIQTRHRIPETPLTEGQILVYQVPIPEPLALPRTARDRDPQDACARGIRADACEALRGHRPQRPYRDDLRLSGQGRGALRDGPVADAEIRQSEDAPVRSAAAVRRGAGKADLRGAAAHRRGQPRFRGPSVRDPAGEQPCALCGAEQSISTR